MEELLPIYIHIMKTREIQTNMREHVKNVLLVYYQYEQTT